MPVSARVESSDFSTHADREGLGAFLASCEETPIPVNHGDRPESFAAELREDGYGARAPGLGETITVPSAPVRR